MTDISSNKVSQSSLLEIYLESFSHFVDSQSEMVKQSLNYEWAWQYDGGESDYQTVVSVMIHGNEVGPLEGLLDIMDALDSGKLRYAGKLICLIGNPEAARLNQRFVDVDLNRVFDPHHTQTDLHEEKRAQSLIPLLNRADLYIDFHQTILESTQPFYICPFNEQTWQWMRLMGGAKVWVTRHINHGGGGLKCADEYVRQRGKASITLELGAAGFSAKSRAGVWKSLNRAINAINQIQAKKSTLYEMSQGEPELQFYETEHRYNFSNPKMSLKEGLVNFQPVSAGETLSLDGSEVSIHAPIDGILLFPKYPRRDESGVALSPRPTELYRIISLLNDHPLTLWPDLRS